MKHISSVFDKALVFNLSAMPIIVDYIQHDLDGFRKTFNETNIITFNFDVWSSTTDTKYVFDGLQSTGRTTILDVLSKLNTLISSKYIDVPTFFYGTTIKEEFENIITDLIKQVNIHTCLDDVVHLARNSMHFNSSIEYDFDNVVIAHLCMHHWVLVARHKTQKILRVLNDSVEIPMNFLECEQIYIVDSHAQTMTKWQKPVKHYPLVHWSSKALLDKLSQNAELSTKKYDFSFGMSNYTGDINSERSVIEETLQKVVNLLPDYRKFFISGNVFETRTKIPYDEYMKYVYESKCTMIIPSYDINAFSVRRISEAINLGTVLIFWSTKNFEQLFPKDSQIYSVYKHHELLLPENPTVADINDVVNRACYNYQQINSLLRHSDIFKSWYDVQLLQRQLLKIIK